MAGELIRQRAGGISKLGNSSWVGGFGRKRDSSFSVPIRLFIIYVVKEVMPYYSKGIMSTPQFLLFSPMFILPLLLVFFMMLSPLPLLNRDRLLLSLLGQLPQVLLVLKMK